MHYTKQIFKLASKLANKLSTSHTYGTQDYVGHSKERFMPDGVFLSAYIECPERHRSDKEVEELVLKGIEILRAALKKEDESYDVGNYHIYESFDDGVGFSVEVPYKWSRHIRRTGWRDFSDPDFKFWVDYD